MSNTEHISAPVTHKNYTPLFRKLIQTVRTKKLKRNELLVVFFLLEKTLSFGKPKDQLTTGVIAYHTGIRKDRVKAAIQGVLDAGIFDRKPSPRFEYEYSIGKSFLDKHKGHFFAPSLPKNRESFRKTEIFSENRGHTDIYPNNSLPLQIQQPVQLSESTVFNLDISDTPNTSCCCCQDKTLAEQAVQSPQISQQNQKTVAPTKKINQWQWADTKLKLPSSIYKSQRTSVLNILKKGTPEQAKEAIKVFDEMEKKGLVRNPPFLLKTLAEASQYNALIVFDENTPPPKEFIPPVPNSLDDALTRYAEKYGFSAPRQAADFTYMHYRKLLRQERNQRLARNENTQLSQPQIRPKNTAENNPQPDEPKAKKHTKNHTPPDLKTFMKSAGL